MPGTLSIGAFVLGAVLLLVALLSGGFKIFGAEVSGGTSTTARVIAFVLGLLFIGVGFATDGDQRGDAPAAAAPVGHPGAPPARVEPAPAATPAAPPARAEMTAPVLVTQRATLRWGVDTAATANLLNNLGANDAQRAAAFVNAAVTQTDIFVIRVSFTNAGTGAVDFSPQRLRALAGGQLLPIETLPRPGFLGAATVQPGQTLEGQLLLQAPMQAMGAGTVTLAYDSPGLEMRYER